MAKKDVDKKLENPVELEEKQLDMIDKAVAIQAPIAKKYVQRLRKKNPSWSDDQLAEAIEKRFVRLATATGVGIGGSASVPGIGTVAALALTVGEGLAFAEACAFLTLGLAEVRGVDMSDPNVRRTVILGVLGGEKGQEIVTKALGKSGLQWGAVLGGKAPGFVTQTVNAQINRWIRRSVARRMTGMWAGRLAPFGIGAVIGGIGNAVLARSVVAAIRNIFDEAEPIVGEKLAESGEAARADSEKG